MQKADSLIRTKVRLPFSRPELVLRPRLQDRIAQGLRVPLTLIIAPAGFGKTTLVVSGTAAVDMPVAWLSLDRNDNQEDRFLSYLVAALQEANPAFAHPAAQPTAAAQQVSAETLLTSLINDLDAFDGEIALVLDDYQFISSQVVHSAVAFLLDHCPKSFHLVLASRSDPPLPLARLRARGQLVELRAGDLRFTEREAAQFLNDVMGLRLDAGSIAALAERTEGWIAGLQMAALSMRDREDIARFIDGFSGTHRYILDYLLEEVLASQPPETQRFLLYTSILERLSAHLCEAVLADDIGIKRAGEDRLSRPDSPVQHHSAATLEYLERANLFLVPLDDERIWYRYHHLFADLLRTQLQKFLGDQEVAQLHLRASDWYEQNGTTLEAIHHASLASDFERVESLIEQHYTELMNRGEMSAVRLWMGKLNKELVYRRPWLCLYDAFSRSWFGQLEEADLLLREAEKRIRSDVSAPDAQVMLGYHAYVKSRVTAMQGDTRRAIEFCLTAREYVPAGNLGLQIEIGITLGYEYFLIADFIHADQILHEMIQACSAVRAINNPVAAYALLARARVLQGLLHAAYELFQQAARLIDEAGEKYLGATGLVKVGTAALLCEWNEVEAALARVKQGLEFLPFWGKADDIALAYTTLARVHFARGDREAAGEAVEKAAQLIHTSGVFSEARNAVETAQVKFWLAQGDWQAVERWMMAVETRFGLPDPFRFEDELTHLTLASVLIAQDKPNEAIGLLAHLEESARLGGRQGRLIEIMLQKALALQALGDIPRAEIALANSLALAEPGGYMRLFLDEGPPIQRLLARWVAHERDHRAADAGASSLRDYAMRLLSQFSAEPQMVTALQGKAFPTGEQVDHLTRREVEVLRQIALGRTNSEIARQLIVSRGTVKAHTASIYRKLDVANRTEAVAARPAARHPALEVPRRFMRKSCPRQGQSKK